MLVPLRVLAISIDRLPVEGFSSFGWAKLYLDKTVESTIDFLENHLLPLSGVVRIHRLLQDTE
jgi:hypothetical protein